VAAVLASRITVPWASTTLLCMTLNSDTRMLCPRFTTHNSESLSIVPSHKATTQPQPQYFYPSRIDTFCYGYMHKFIGTSEHLRTLSLACHDFPLPRGRTRIYVRQGYEARLFSGRSRRSKATEEAQSFSQTSYRSTGSTVFMPWYLSNLAMAYADVGQFDDALSCSTKR
jgi:hypothetical protein